MHLPTSSNVENNCPLIQHDADETVDGEAGKEFPMRGELDNCDEEYVERRVKSPGREELEKHGEDNLGIAGRSKREPSGYSTRTHSTLGDKNFVQNYFKASSFNQTFHNGNSW